MSSILTHVQHATNSVVEHTNQALTSTRDTCIWMGRKVHDFTSRFLPEPFAKIVALSLIALPLTACLTGLSFVLPEVAFLIVMGLPFGIWQTGLARKIDETVGMENRQAFLTGIRDASIIQIGIHTAAMITTGNWFILLPIVTNLATAVQTGLAAIKPTPPEKKPEQPQA